MPDEVAVKKLSAVQLALIQKLAEKLKALPLLWTKKTARDKLRAINAEGTKAAALVLDPNCGGWNNSSCKSQARPYL